MFRYLVLINFTDQGARNVDKSVARASSFSQSVEAAGRTLIAQYWAIGEVDGCVVFEAPDETTASKLLVQLAKDGNVRTRTSRILNNEEFQKVLI